MTDLTEVAEEVEHFQEEEEGGARVNGFLDFYEVVAIVVASDLDTDWHDVNE